MAYQRPWPYWTRLVAGVVAAAAVVVVAAVVAADLSRPPRMAAFGNIPARGFESYTWTARQWSSERPDSMAVVVEYKPPFVVAVEEYFGDWALGCSDCYHFPEPLAVHLVPESEPELEWLVVAVPRLVAFVAIFAKRPVSAVAIIAY